MFNIKNYHLKYILIILIIVIFAVCLYISKTGASVNYVFSRSIGEQPTFSPGDRYLPLYYVNDFAFDSEGNKYIIDYYFVHKFDSSGVYLLSFGKPGTSDGDFTFTTRIAIDSQDNIYVTDAILNRVQKFDSDGNFILKFGTTGSGDGEFGGAWGIGIDSQDRVFVVESSNNRVQLFDTNGNFVSKFGTTGSGDGQFNYPSDIAFDDEDNMYISDYYNERVQKFSSSTDYVTEFSAPGEGLYGLDLDNDGNLYVFSDLGYILKYSSSTAFIDSFGSFGQGVGEFYGESSDITFGPDGNLYISDYDKISIFDTDGTYINMWASNAFPAQDGVVYGAVDVALDEDGYIYVADGNNNRIQKFDSSGVYISQFGISGSGDGQFNYPTDIEIDIAGNIYAVDFFNNRIQKFDSSGNFVSKFGTAGSGDGNMSNPKGVDVDDLGYIYVSDTDNSRIQKFDSSGNFVSKFGSYSLSNNSIYFPDELLVASDGDIYVSNRSGNNILVFSSAPLLLTSVSSTASTSTATITWTSSAAASSQVEYGLTTSFGTSTVESDTSPRVTSHTVTLSNLLSCSTYSYRVKSTNADLVTTISTSTSFNTAGCTGMSEVLSTNEVKASSTATSTVSLEVIALTIPPSVSTSTEIVFQAKKLEPVTFFEEAKTPTGKIAVGTSVFNLSAIDIQTNDKVSTFSKPILISTTYSPSDLNGIDPNTLAIYRYDGSAWFPLSNCSTNTDTYTVSCYTSNFSDFALFATPVSTTNTSNTSGGGLILPINAQVGDTNTNTATVAMNPVQQAINSLNTVSIKFSRNLKRGISGTDVSTLQQYLSTIPGIYPEALITGYFGNLTYKAVKRYQCQYDIVCMGTEEGTGWGVVGKRTRGMMGQ